MSTFEVLCPTPLPTLPTQTECQTEKTVSWSTPSTFTTTFYVEGFYARNLGLIFTPLSNNGSNISVAVKYFKNGVYGTQQTYSLSTLPSAVTKYHALNFGDPNVLSGTITLEITTTGGSTGSFKILLDCDITVCNECFCYIPLSTKFSDICSCYGASSQTVYWDCQQGATKSLISYGPWYTDIELQTPAPAGYYTQCPIEGFKNPNSVVYKYPGGAGTAIVYSVCGTDNSIYCYNGSDTKTVTHTKTGYTANNPYLVFNNTQPKSTLKWSIKTISIELANDSHQVVPIKVCFTGQAESVVFTVSDPSVPGGIGMLSYSANSASLNTGDLFYAIDLETLFSVKTLSKSNFGCVTINVNVNGTTLQKTTRLLVRVAVGQKIKYNSNSTVYTSVTALCPPMPVYKELVGLHTYSAYDSAYSPKLTTYLYSLTPMASWVAGTNVFNDGELSHPALPWYYCSGNNIFKVGIPFKREYATKTTYKQYTSQIKAIGALLKIVKNPYTIKEVLEGPKDWFTLIGGVPKVPNCINPLMDPGKIWKVYTKSSIPQPTKYWYLMGVNANKDNSNDLYFNYWNFDSKTFIPITGIKHAQMRLPQGYISGANKLNSPAVRGLNGSGWQSMAIAGLLNILSTVVLTSLVDGVALKKFDKTSWQTVCKRWINKIVNNVLGENLSRNILKFIPFLPWANLIWQLFRRRTTYFEEVCNYFENVYTTTPYVEIGTRLWNQSGFTTSTTGYYCDGAYFYYQSSNQTQSKEISYTTYGGTIDHSLIPDDPTLVQEIPSLFFLPYVSGRPIQYPPGTVFPNPSVSSVQYPTEVGALNNPLPITYEIPEGTIESLISVNDAEADALTYLQELTANTISYVISSEPKGGITGETVTFTHEITNESNPSNFGIFYENSDLSGISVGKTLYYDSNGFYSLLNGYYAIPASDSNYQFFYKLSAGTVIDKLIMSSATATQVISNVTSQVYPLNNTYTGYTSTWYFTSPVYNDIQFNQINNLNDFNTIWNTNQFYNHDIVKKGMISTPTSKDSLLVYDDNLTGTTIYSADTGWYFEIPQVYNGEPFTYITGTTLTISSIQYCSSDILNGVIFQCQDEFGEPIPSMYGVSFNVSIYTGGTYDSSHTITIEGSEYEKLLPLDVSYIGQITNVVITGYNSPNPIDSITFTAGTFTACSVPTPTPTPMVTPTPTPSSLGCECHDGIINNNNSFSYYDCTGSLISGGAESGTTVCFDINKFYTGNIIDLGVSEICSCSSPTPTPTSSSITPEASYTPTPTVTPTPSTEPTPPLTYDHYYADKYDCGTCTVDTPNVLVAFPSGQSVIINNWYPDTGAFSYKILSSTLDTGGYILTNLNGSFGSCAAACGV